MKKMPLFVALLALTSCSFTPTPQGGVAIEGFHYVAKPIPLNFETDRLEFQHPYREDALKTKMMNAQLPSEMPMDYFNVESGFVFSKNTIESFGFGMVSTVENFEESYAIFRNDGTNQIVIWNYGSFIGGIADNDIYDLQDASNHVYGREEGNYTVRLSDDESPLIYEIVRDAKSARRRESVSYTYDEQNRVTSAITDSYFVQSKSTYTYDDHFFVEEWEEVEKPNDAPTLHTVLVWDQYRQHDFFTKEVYNNSPRSLLVYGGHGLDGVRGSFCIDTDEEGNTLWDYSLSFDGGEFWYYHLEKRGDSLYIKSAEHGGIDPEVVEIYDEFGNCTEIPM